MNKPHGTRGEVFVWPLTDHPERTFVPGEVLFPAGPDERSPSTELPALRIGKARPFRRGFLVAFEGWGDRTTVERLRDLYLLRRFDDVEPAEEDELFYHELLGMTVETTAGRTLGSVAEVYELRPSDLLEVRGPTGAFLIPFTRRVVASVDRENRRLVVDPPAGLLDL